MNISQACEVLKQYAEKNTDGDFLMALTVIQNDIDEESDQTRSAYDKFITVGQEFFAEV